MIFAADAALTVWRRGDRRQALVVGGGIVFFTLMGGTQSSLALWGIIAAPVMPSLFFVGVVLAMGLELSRDVLRAAELSDELRESQQRIDLAASAAELGLWIWDIARDLQMSGLSGFEVIARLEGRFPVVVITAHDSSEAEARALAGGAAAYLRKPVNDRELIEEISAAIAHLTARTWDHP